MKQAKEGLAEVGLSEKVFFNPEMKLCRDISSLVVGAIGKRIGVLDAFCATGARGIRYAKENKNVEKVTFLDIDENAIGLAEKMLKGMG